ncbi:MAG: transporter [Comamonadaceae bacterium]|nr:transporter [Comamonadaceae bacterium]
MPGEPVRGAITARGASHWIVPRAALLRDARGAYVYQVDRGRARRVDVELRVDDGKRLGVDGPLDVGQPLVVQGNYQLADGMAVREGGS